MLTEPTTTDTHETPKFDQALLDETNPFLNLWLRLERSDPFYVREADKGRYKFHTIDATYQKKRVTALWGPYGDRWGLRDIEYGFTKAADGTIAEAFMKAKFFYPGDDGKTVEFEIINDWVWSRAGETFKKLMTNTLIKALSYVGVSADLWLGRFEDDPYREAHAGQVAEKAENIVDKLRHAPADKIDEWWEVARKRGLNRYNYAEAKKAYDARKLEIETEDTFGGPDPELVGPTDAEAGGYPD